MTPLRMRVANEFFGVEAPEKKEVKAVMRYNRDSQEQSAYDRTEEMVLSSPCLPGS